MNIEKWDTVDVPGAHLSKATVHDDHYGRYGRRLAVSFLDKQGQVAKQWFFESECRLCYPCLRKITNQYGHPQMVLVEEDGTEYCVCPSCHALVRPNRGEGMDCDDCQTEFMNYCAHDDYFI